MDTKTLEPNEHLIVAGCFDEEVGIYKYPVVPQDDVQFLLSGQYPQLLPMSDDPTPKAVILPEVVAEDTKPEVIVGMETVSRVTQPEPVEEEVEMEVQGEFEDHQPYEHSKDDDVNFLKQAAAEVSRAAPPAMAQVDAQQQASLLRAFESLANAAEDEESSADPPAPTEESSCAMM